MLAQNNIAAEVTVQNRRSAKDSFLFEGIDKANGTIFPDVLLDKVMPFLTPSEWKVCSYIVRRTFGWKKEEDDISLDQICNGIVKRDGTRLDFGTQMDKKTVIRALKGLDKKGVIAITKNYSSRRGFEASTYSLRFKGQTRAPTLVSKSHKDSEVLVPFLHKLRVVELNHHPSSTDANPLGAKEHIQTTKDQTIELQENKRTTTKYVNNQLWDSILYEMKRQVPKSSFDAWLEGSHQLSASDNEVLVAVPTKTEKDCIERRLGFLVQRVALRVAGKDVTVKFVAKDTV